jgi:hypothetical protein
VRDGRGLAWLGGLALDVKLAARLLARYPWLTVVGCAAMAFGIAAGVAGFEARTQLVNPSLPLDEGSQIVGLRNWDTSRNRVASTTAADFVAWRDSLTRVRDISAASVFRRNLIADDGGAETVAAAAMTASAFRVTRVSPLLGRTFLRRTRIRVRRRSSSSPTTCGRGDSPATRALSAELFDSAASRQRWSV